MSRRGAHSCSSRSLILPISERPKAPPLTIGVRLEYACLIRSNNHILTLERGSWCCSKALDIPGVPCGDTKSFFSDLGGWEAPLSFELAENDA